MYIALIIDKSKYHYFSDYFTNFIKLVKIPVYIIDYQDVNLYNKLLKSKIIISVQTLLLQPKSWLKDRLYVFNFEQNTRKSEYYQHLLSILDMGIKVIDYSQANINILNQDTKNKYADLLYYLPFPVIFENSTTGEKDICFTGGISEYRAKCLNGISLDVINKFGKERDDELKKYKICVNVGYNKDYQILEQTRCYHAIGFKVLIISDYKLPENDQIENLIIFTKPENLKETINNVLENYDKIWNEKYSPENIKNITEYSITNIKKFVI